MNMTYRLNEIDIQELIDIHKIDDWENQHHKNKVWSFKSNEEHIGKDYKIISSSYKMEDDTKIAVAESSTLLELHFNLSPNKIEYKNNFNSSTEVKPFKGNMIYIAPTDSNSELTFYKDVNYNTFDIHLSAEVLQKYYGLSDKLDHFIDRINKGLSTAYTENDIDVDKHILNAIQQIRDCQYHGITARLFKESKILEILCYSLENNKTDNKSKLSHHDQNCIHEAAIIIERNINSPLTISQLAKQIGINQSKLKIGFKQLYGTTVFGYLQSKRLQLAKEYLANTDISIQEISEKTGYSDLSNFSAAFKHYIGVAPQKYRYLK